MTASASLQPVERQSMEARTAANLRSHILSGAWPPGARITEIALAEGLGVARATVRTGLQKLAAEGIVVQIPYTGWEIASLSQTDAWELWTLRSSLEGLASRLAVQRMDDAQRQRIGQVYADLCAACRRGDEAEVNQLDFKLHQTIVEAASHKRLSMQYRLVEQQVRLYIATSNTSVVGNMDVIIGEHEPIVASVLGGDPERAEQEARRHNETEGPKFVQRLQRDGERGSR